MMPRSAACPLSRELRAGLQLRLVDSQSMTYSSHGTPRVGSLATTPRWHADGNDALPQSELTEKRRWNASLPAILTTDPVQQQEEDEEEKNPKNTQKKEEKELQPLNVIGSFETTASRVDGALGSSSSFASSLPPVRLGAMPPTEGYATPSAAAAAVAPSLPSHHVGQESNESSFCKNSIAGGFFRKPEVVDSIAELFQIDVVCTTTSTTTTISAETLSIAEWDALSKKSETEKSALSSMASPDADNETGQEKYKLSYRKVKNRFLSWFHLKKEAKPAAGKSHKSSASDKAASLPSKKKKESPRCQGGSSPSLFPTQSKVSFPLRFYTPEDYQLLLRWYIWMWHTRKQRRERVREQQERHHGPSYISYHPRDIARDNERSALLDNDDDERETLHVVDSGMNWKVEPAVSNSSLGGVGGAVLNAAMDRRWEDYLRRERDPRNEVRFAPTPVFLWHSFLPLASSVFYVFDRGFLAIEACTNSDSGGVMLSPLRAARHAEPFASADGDAGGGASRGHSTNLPRRASWNTVTLVVSSPLEPNAKVAGGFPHVVKNSDAADAPVSGSETNSLPLPLCNSPAASASTSPQHIHHAHRHRTSTESDGEWNHGHPAGAEYKDCFMCLTESHLLFYSSFGELKAHFSLDHVGAVLYSASHVTRQETAKGGKKEKSRKGGAVGSKKGSPRTKVEPAEPGDDIPPSYPFVTFKIKAGKEELSEPPLLFTFTFLPLWPHVTAASLAKDNVSGPQVSSSVGTTSGVAVFPNDSNTLQGGRAGTDHAHLHHKNNSGSSESEDLDVYHARMRVESSALIFRKNEFLSTLREVVPNTFSEPLSFSAYVRAVHQQAEQPVHPTLGQLGENPLGKKVPMVEIFPEDIITEIDCQAFSTSNSSSTTVSHSASSSCGTGGDLRPPPPPRTLPHRHRGHSLTFSNGESTPTPPGHITVPRSRAASSYCGVEEHRRLQHLYANSSSLSRLLTTRPPGATEGQANDMDRVNDFDLAVRLASHPVPMLLEKEDLFIPPLRFYASNSFASSGHASSLSHSATADREQRLGSASYRKRTKKGPGHTPSHVTVVVNNSITRADIPEDVFLHDIERGSNPRVCDSAESSTADKSKDPLGEKPLMPASPPQSSTSAGAPFAVMRPRKRDSYLKRSSKAKREGK